jgi:hypothetical protein
MPTMWLSLLGQVVGRRVAHLPRLRLIGLVPAGQAGHDATHELLVVVHVDRAVGMHDLVVPGRHEAMRLVLAGYQFGEM